VVSISLILISAGADTGKTQPVLSDRYFFRIWLWRGAAPVLTSAPRRSLSSFEHLFADFRTDLDTHGSGLRSMAATFGLNRSLVQAFSTFYYTRAIKLVPALKQFADASGRERARCVVRSGALRFFSAIVTGIVRRPFAVLRFQKHPFAGSNRSLISSTATIGYTWKCCSVTVQDYTFNVGLRNENRFVFAFG